MKILYICLSLLVLAFDGKSQKKVANFEYNGNSKYLTYSINGIPYVVSDSAWTADLQGNHRAVVKVGKANKLNAVAVELPWRRPDLHPETKRIIVKDVNNKEVKNVYVEDITSEKGKIIFEPISGSGIYYIYYLPYKFRKSWADARYGKPWNDYLEPVYQSNSTWVNKLPTAFKSLPKAKVLRMESRTSFDSFTSMGLIATENEIGKIKNKNPENPIIFTEDRAFPIRLKNQIPIRWVENGSSKTFSGTALRNEYYVWQIGIWAAHEELKNVKLHFSDLINGNKRISKDKITCFNQEGINWDGKPVAFTVNVPLDKVQALWCGIQIPENAGPGVYKGIVRLTADGVDKEIEVKIQVKDQVLADKGDSELWRHSRLRWLNSTIGSDNDPVFPYESMTMTNNEIHASGKSIFLNENGLPKNIKINDHEVIAEPIAFIVQTENRTIKFNAKNFEMSKKSEGLVTWTSTSAQEGITFRCDAYMEYDGYIRYTIHVASEKGPIAVKDVKLMTTYSTYASQYFMGVGYKGGKRPVEYTWDWKGPYDSYWIGNAKAGLHVEYRGGSYHGPLLNDYKPAPPASWYNNGKGSLHLTTKSNALAELTISTGATDINSTGQNFEFSLLITPVKPINSSKHFSERYFQANPIGFEKASSDGANIANIHHAQKLNPVINYPFIVRDSLISFIQKQHDQDRKVKLYYTVREMTNYMEEIFAMHSLNNEIFEKGVGYGVPWHMEHLIDGYKPAWYTELPGETSDAALVTSGFSRLINYYLEGLKWMLENYKIDGIYLDDVSFDRNVLKRMRKIMQKYRPGALIDLHSNTGYSKGPANQYTDYFPYIDRIWFGESFKYNEMSPDEWFVTFSGIPYGQMSEMLQDGGNRFLGMVYGATARHSYADHSPVPVWNLWKSFGIEKAEMLGYWDENCPVNTSDPNVKATAYIKKDKVLVSIGNFDKETKNIELIIDWNKLGMKPSKVSIVAPEVKDFQKEHKYTIKDRFTIDAKKGLLLIISKNE